MESAACNGIAESRLDYIGQQFDKESSLGVFGVRKFSADIGRFTSIEPLWEKYYAISPYAYSANNPISFLDGTGYDLRDVNRAAFLFNGIMNNAWEYTAREDMERGGKLVLEKGWKLSLPTEINVDEGYFGVDVQELSDEQKDKYLVIGHYHTHPSGAPFSLEDLKHYIMYHKKEYGVIFVEAGNIRYALEVNNKNLANFIFKFWDELEDIYFDAYNKSIENGLSQIESREQAVKAIANLPGSGLIFYKSVSSKIDFEEVE